MKIAPETLRRAMACLVVACALVLVPAVAASASPSINAPSFPADGLRRGGTGAVAPVQVDPDQRQAKVVSQFTIHLNGVCDSTRPSDANGCDVPVFGFSGPEPLKDTPANAALGKQEWIGAVVSFLSTKGGSHLQFENASLNFLSDAEKASGSRPAGWGAGDWYVTILSDGVTSGTFAGLVCFAYGNANWAPPYDPAGETNPTPAPDADPGPCGRDGGMDVFGLPRAEDMGYKGTGAGRNQKPGQNADGTIDIADCVRDRLATQDGGILNPATIVAPIQCAFEWATTPPTDMTNELVGTQTALWNSTQLGATMNSVNFFDDVPSAGCSGIEYNFDFLHIPGQAPLPKPGNLLAACAGSDLKPVADLVFLGLSLAVLIGGAIKLTRVISAFVKGPQLDDQPQWEDTRLF